jgi:hypothetical protein
MCISCGCGAPDDTRGDARQITGSQLKAAAEANDLTLIQTAENVLAWAKDQPESEQRPKASGIPTDEDVQARPV